MSHDLHSSPQSARPPIPPPLPPPPPPHLGLRVSPFVLNTRSAPPGWFYEYQSPKPPPQVNPFELPTGPYFVYGTLMDPNMVADILKLEDEPILRPAKIVGYTCKLWGQYPAMQDGPQDAPVTGAVYHVESASDAKRLADYETSNYKMPPCLIPYTDGIHPASELGHVFTFNGNPKDLDEGRFDLALWLRMGRQPAA
ncbi:poly polymerase [Ophiostoma piceae UAMH 11346]|uniref:Putative gamma-glutamylcyclotransferase n=1 Tax=Ophiostoma piceae (strain UAMH 11346) TaxID=1262450 RepID=S3BRF3_OPHP1|nr:poly polymerase [Ophiostoma piceae UAMH 11346]